MRNTDHYLFDYDGNCQDDHQFIQIKRGRAVTSRDLANELDWHPVMDVFVQVYVEGEIYWYPVRTVELKERDNGERCLVIQSGSSSTCIRMSEAQGD